MIVGVGLDILYLPRLTRFLQRRGYEGIARRILTLEERKAFQATLEVANNVGAEQRAARYLAVRWTAKEAAYKALHPYRITTWKGVEVVKMDKTGTRPILRWTNPTKTDSEILLHLSVSHDGDYVASTVISERVS